MDFFWLCMCVLHILRGFNACVCPIVWSFLRRMLGRFFCHFSGRCFAASVLGYCWADALPLQFAGRMFGSRSGYFAATVVCLFSGGYLGTVVSSLAETLPLLSYRLPWRMVCHQGLLVLSLADTFAATAVGSPPRRRRLIHCRLPMCCSLSIIGSVC